MIPRPTCFQGISWSSIEYSGRWKVLQYAMGAAFAPVTIYPFWTPENQTLEILVSSDRWETVNGTAQLVWFDWSGNELNTSLHEFSTPTLNNSMIFSATGLDSILPAGTNASDAWMLLNLTAEADSGKVTVEQYVCSGLTLINYMLIGFISSRLHPCPRCLLSTRRLM